MSRAAANAYLGMYMANVNAQTVVKTGNVLSHKLVGGIMDFYIFFSNSPTHVTQLYHNIIGKPALFPYSMMNWHVDLQSYSTVAEVNKTIIDFS